MRQSIFNLFDRDWETLRTILEEEGYAKREEFEQEQLQSRAANYSKTALDEAVEEFGESFGSKDESGQFSWNPDVEDSIVATSKRITNEAEGVTERDLYILAQHKQLIEQAFERGRLEAAQGRQEAISKRQSAQTVNASVPNSTSAPTVYEKDKGDRLSDVVTRSLAIAAQEHS